MAKTLVVYYSYTGNSKKIALYAKEKLQADILELLPVEPFSDDYDAVVEEWQNNDLKRDVEIKDIGVNLSIYDKVVLITCTWWYGISPVMKKFLKEYDLSGKDVLVGSTNAGWLGHSLKDYLLSYNLRSHSFTSFIGVTNLSLSYSFAEKTILSSPFICELGSNASVRKS